MKIKQVIECTRVNGKFCKRIIESEAGKEKYWEYLMGRVKDRIK